MEYLKIIILFSLSISSINSIIINQEGIKINEEQNFDIKSLTKYAFDISQIQNEKYIYLEVFGKNINNNYILSIVYDFENQNRIQLAQSVKGNTSLILSKEQIKGNKINIILECSDYSSCSGTLKKQSFNKIPLKENKPFYYYNSIDNMIMEFSLNSNSEILNIWVKDDLDITTILEGAEYTKYNNGNFYLVNNTNKTEITLKVIGKKGDYVNVGFVGYNKNNKRNNYYLSSELIKDGYILTSYLNKNITSKYCYSFENFDIKNEKIICKGEILFKSLSYELGYYDEHEGHSSGGSFREKTIYLDEIEKYNSLCFYLDQGNNEAIYTFQIYSNITFEKQLNKFELQNNGIFYKYKLKPSEKKILISQNLKNSENIFYYLYSPVSSSYLYIINCYNYPLCSSNNTDFNKSSSVFKIGKASSINLKKDMIFDFSPINKHQKLFVVKCDDNAKNDCDIETLISSDNSEINIVDFDNFVERYSFTNQIDKYKISNLLYYTKGGINNFLIEINVIVGEVDIIADFPKGIELNEIDNLNKISLFIKMENENKHDFLNFSIKSLDNSFYSIIFFPNIYGKNIFSPNTYITYGIPRLYTFSSKNDAETFRNIILLPNANPKFGFYKTANIKSLNCEIDVYQTNMDGIPVNKLLKYENFYHFTPKEIDSQLDLYLVNITKDDFSEYNNKVCQMYLSFLDNIEKESDSNYVDLLVLDNIPQQIMFNKNFTHVSYGYYITKPENDIIIKYSSKHKVKYDAKIYYSNKKREKEENIMGEGILYLNYEEWDNICKNQTCLIKIDISLNETDFEQNPEPILELSIKSLEEKIVTYIPKHQLIKDYIHYQKSQYYYTEIGKNEIGYINAHFLKGSGEIVAKIVEVDKTEINPDWKGKYILPTKNKADFKMDTFTKKIKFSSEKYNCENKCYLIINVFSDIKADKIPGRSIYPYTLFIQSYPKNLDKISLPVISIPLDEYILGSLEKEKGNDNYEFYKIQLNLICDKIIIDIHSNIEKIFVKIGDQRPIIDNNDISLTLKNNDNDNVFIITKEEILKYSPKSNLTDLIITFSLYSSKFNDTINTIPYSFSVRLSNENGKDIYKINSEHVSLRNSKQSKNVEGKYQLLYLIKYDYINDNSSLVISARNSDNTNINLTIKAKYIDYDDYLL